MGGGSVEPSGARAPDLIDAMSPPGYPSARLRPRRAGFRFTRPLQCNPAAQASPVTVTGILGGADKAL